MCLHGDHRSLAQNISQLYKISVVGAKKRDKIRVKSDNSMNSNGCEGNSSKKKLLFLKNTKQIRLKKNDLAEYGKKRQPMEGKKVNSHKRARAKNRTLGLSPKFR